MEDNKDEDPCSSSITSTTTTTATTSLEEQNQMIIAEHSEKIEMRIKKREENINRRFARMSRDLTENPEEFAAISQRLTSEDEDTANNSFQDILVDNFTEDRSEEWISNESLEDNNNHNQHLGEDRGSKQFTPSSAQIVSTDNTRGDIITWKHNYSHNISHVVTVC